VIFNLTKAKDLLNGTYGLFNTTYAGLFMSLVSEGTTDNFTTINMMWGLDTNEAAALAGYMQYLMAVFVPGPLIAQFNPVGVATLTDLGYLQWTNSLITSGLSIYDLDPTVAPNYPEYWAWAEKISGSNDYGITFTLAEAKDLLNGTYGLFDTTYAAFFLGLVSEGTVENFTTINTMWGLNTTEAAALAGYMQYLMAEFVPDGIIDQFSPLGVAALTDLAYLQWTNSIITSGLSIYDIDPSVAPNYPEYWAWAEKVTDSADLGITFTLAEVKSLLTGAYSLTDGVNSMNFLTLVSGGTEDNLTMVSTIWGLNTTEAAAIAGYMNYIISQFVPVGLIDSFGPLGYTAITDIAYLQFATPYVTSGLSLKDLQTLPGYPEPWAYANRTLDTAYTLSLANSKALLSGIYNLTEATSFGALLQYGVLGDNTTINTLFGTTFDSTDVQMLAGYLNYLLTTFVDGYVLQPVFDAGGGFITTRTINEWLWDGTDPLLEFLMEQEQVESAESNLFANHTSLADAEIKEENMADTIKTGKDDIDTVLVYVKYEEKTVYTGIWASDEQVRGTDATQFAPDVSKDDILVTWVSELFRAVDLEFQSEVKEKGIKLYRFVLTEETMDVDPNYYQTIKGVANMTSTQDGVPLFLSKPHFLHADPSLELPSADASKHDTVIDVEPISGATMSGRKRLQINFKIEAGDAFTKNVSEGYMSVVWVEEGATIPEDSAEDFKDTVYGAQDLQQVALFGGPTIGIVLLGAAGGVAALNIMRARKLE
ncbi:MAG: hypothetical protein ACFFCQ_00605, partial [Promethearchaeota archaeon]